MDYSINNSRPLLDQSEISESDDYLDNDFNSPHLNGTLDGNHEIMDDDNRNLIQNKRSVPADKLNFNYMIFYLLGISSLIPWNFVMTAEDYWMFKFRNTTANSTNIPLTPIQAGFTSDLSVAASIPNTLFLILNAFLSHKIPLAIRMIGSLILIFGLFIVLTIFVEVNTDDWQAIFFIMTISMVIVMNIASAILSGGLFGIAGLFPSEYITAVVSGQALGGIFAAVAEIISLTFGASPKATAFVYFNVANVTLLLSLICYVIMSKTLFFKFFTNNTYSMNKPMVTSSSPAVTVDSELVIASRESRQLEPSFGTVLSKIWLYGFSEWFIFVTTLSVYPSVTVLINSQYKGNGHPWNDIYFVTVVNYLIFNSGDYLGRILAGIFEWPKNRPVLIAILTVMRLIFIPLLLLCNEMPRHNLPVVIHSDIIVILIMCIFSFTNGYIANISFICAPKAVLDHEREMASSMMAAFLGIGLAFGSSISMIFVELI